MCRLDFIALAWGEVSEIMIVREQSKSNLAEKYLSMLPLLLGSRNIRSEGDGQRQLVQGDIAGYRRVCAAVERQDKICHLLQTWTSRQLAGMLCVISSIPTAVC